MRPRIGSSGGMLGQQGCVLTGDRLQPEPRAYERACLVCGFGFPKLPEACPAPVCSVRLVSSVTESSVSLIMSGVEIAGLALGVLPILIAAAEHIKSRRLDPRRAVFMENLAFEIVFLQMSLTKLAKGLTELPDETREKLVASQATQEMDASWKRDEVKHALKARLGSGQETFVVTLKAVLDCLERLLEKKSFSLSNNDTVCAISKGASNQADVVIDVRGARLREIARDSRHESHNTKQSSCATSAVRNLRSESMRSNLEQNYA